MKHASAAIKKSQLTTAHIHACARADTVTSITGLETIENGSHGCAEKL